MYSFIEVNVFRKGKLPVLVGLLLDCFECNQRDLVREYGGPTPFRSPKFVCWWFWSKDPSFISELCDAVLSQRHAHWQLMYRTLLQKRVFKDSGENEQICTIFIPFLHDFCVLLIHVLISLLCRVFLVLYL